MLARNLPAKSHIRLNRGAFLRRTRTMQSWKIYFEDTLFLWVSSTNISSLTHYISITAAVMNSKKKNILLSEINVTKLCPQRFSIQGQ